MASNTPQAAGIQERKATLTAKKTKQVSKAAKKGGRNSKRSRPGFRELPTSSKEAEEEELERGTLGH